MASNEDVLFHLHAKLYFETRIRAAAVRERAGGGDLAGGDIAVIAVAVRNGRVIVDIRSGGGGVGVTHRAQHQAGGSRTVAEAHAAVDIEGHGCAVDGIGDVDRIGVGRGGTGVGGCDGEFDDCTRDAFGIGDVIDRIGDHRRDLGDGDDGIGEPFGVIAGVHGVGRLHGLVGNCRSGGIGVFHVNKRNGLAPGEMDIPAGAGGGRPQRKQLPAGAVEGSGAGDGGGGIRGELQRDGAAHRLGEVVDRCIAGEDLVGAVKYDCAAARREGAAVDEFAGDRGGAAGGGEAAAVGEIAIDGDAAAPAAEGAHVIHGWCSDVTAWGVAVAGGNVLFRDAAADGQRATQDRVENVAVGVGVFCGVFVVFGVRADDVEAEGKVVCIDIETREAVFVGF